MGDYFDDDCEDYFHDDDVYGDDGADYDYDLPDYEEDLDSHDQFEAEDDLEYSDNQYDEDYLDDDMVGGIAEVPHISYSSVSSPSKSATKIGKKHTDLIDKFKLLYRDEPGAPKTYRVLRDEEYLSLQKTLMSFSDKHSRILQQEISFKRRKFTIIQNSITLYR